MKRLLPLLRDQRLVMVALLAIAFLVWHLGGAPLGDRVTIRETVWHIDGIALTEADRTRGLSFRSTLNRQSGLLFLFPTPSHYGFWMKDMQFPIDIIFLRDGVVDSVARARTPGDLVPVYPTGPIDQVFEVNAGEAAALEPGDRAVFEIGQR